MNSIFFKIKNILANPFFYTKRALIKFSKNPRPSSYPYISGDSFRSMSDHILDNLSKINPTEVKGGDILFVQTDMVESFFKDIHPNIKSNYILISHNSDLSINETFIKYIDDKVLHWFSQNVEISHSKITPLPIGLENLHYYRWGVISRLSSIRKKATVKINRILFGFNIETNKKVRSFAFSNLNTSNLADPINGHLSENKYFQELNRYAFVASPQGNGIDCHRTWEAVYLGVVPIVDRSTTTEYFASIGVPLFIIDSWGEIKDIKESTLISKKIDIDSKKNQDVLWMPYWQKIIKDKKHE